MIGCVLIIPLGKTRTVRYLVYLVHGTQAREVSIGGATRCSNFLSKQLSRSLGKKQHTRQRLLSASSQGSAWSLSSCRSEANCSRKEHFARERNEQPLAGRIMRGKQNKTDLPFGTFFPISFIILALLSCSLPVVTRIRGDIVGPSPPSLLRYTRCAVGHVYRGNNSAFPSLVDSRRNYAAMIQMIRDQRPNG